MGRVYLALIAKSKGFMTKVYGLIGYPVKHSYSAAMHNAAFRELGIDARYELFEIEPARLEEGFRKLIEQGVCGFNVTVPHKERIIQFLDGLGEEAALAGAVNTVKVSDDKTVRGFNTDGLGFITHLMQVVGFEPRGKSISILGAGGAAKALAFQLAKHQAQGIALFDLDREKAKSLANKLRTNFSQCRVRVVTQANALLKAQPELLINATPVGMHPDDPVVFDSGLFHSSLIVYDLVYNPAQTPLLREAKRKRCAGVFNGLGLLLYQGVLAFKIWLDVEPPIEVMDRALREILTQPKQHSSA